MYGECYITANLSFVSRLLEASPVVTVSANQLAKRQEYINAPCCYFFDQICQLNFPIEFALRFVRRTVQDTEKLNETNEHLNTCMKPTMRNLKRRLSTNTVEETQKYYFYSYCSKFSQY